MRRAPLWSAAGLLLTGAVQAARESGPDALAALFLSAGFIVLGAWLAVELTRPDDRDRP